MNDSHPIYAICINNNSNPASLQPRKLYRVLPDKDAAAHNQIRIVDEEEEDYLYPEDCFIIVKFDPDVIKALEETNV